MGTVMLETMHKPRALRAGDRLAVVAPASPFARDEFDRGVAELKTLGFEPVYTDQVFARRGFVAGEPAARAAAVQQAWADPSIAGILCVRGGYGSAQILPFLDLARLQATPKVFVGYSDITSMLTWLTLQGGLVTFHGPMLAGRFSLGADGYDRDTFLRAVTSTEAMGELPSDALEIVRPGEARGPLLGGTLTQLLASLGTPFAFDPPPGHVLFLDEVGERPYRVDRMLTQLRQTGLLARASAVVFNELRNCDEPGGGAAVRDVVRDLLRDFPGPVLMGLPSGHSTGPSITLPFGVRAAVSVQSASAHVAPRIIIEEPAVL
jgi:muramoyltetrapeptide carboxypeptidase